MRKDTSVEISGSSFP